MVYVAFFWIAGLWIADYFKDATGYVYLFTSVWITLVVSSGLTIFSKI